MSLQWPYLILLVPAAFLIWDDFRTREIAVMWLALLGILSIWAGRMAYGLHTMLLQATINLVIILLFGAALIMYRLLRHRPVRNFFIHSFGAGDVVMISVVAPLFEPAGYVYFLLLSCVAALIWWIVKRSATIPLAGFMALTLAVYSIFETTEPWIRL